MPGSAANSYETVYVLKSGVSDAEASTIHQKVDNVITKFEGSLKQRDDWGLKELDYPIIKDTNGRYTVIIYTGKSGVVEEIERHFKISSDVIRYLTVAVEPGYDYEKVKKQMALFEEEAKKNREFRDQRKRS